MKMTPIPAAAFALALFLMTLLLFFPAVRHQFLNYDDNLMVTENPHVLKGLSLEGTAWAFANTHAHNWIPLTWFSHMADVEVFGAIPAGHHLVSLLLHSSNAALLFLVLLAMTGAPWRSFAVAALFAVHPLHVESAAWVAERKDVLSAFFWFLAMGAYCRYARAPSWSRYLAVAAAFALGLMAKPMLVTLPFALLLLDWWPLERLRAGRPFGGPGGGPPSLQGLALEKVPLLALAAASSAVTFAAQRGGGAVAELQALPAAERLSNALTAYVAYLWKTVWPRDLAVFYPLPPEGPRPVEAAGAALFLATVTVLVLRLRRHHYLPVGWFWYLGTLVPVIGLVQVGSQSMADRYTYIPLTGIFIALVWGVSEGARRLGIGPAVTGPLAAAIITLFAFQARHQLGTWRDSGTLFTHALEVTENNHLAHNNLGTFLADGGREEEALLHLQEAVRIEPDFAEARFNLGNRYLNRGDLPAAREHYREALRLDPGMAGAHLNLGLLDDREGDLESAVVHYRAALELDRRLSGAHVNLGAALERAGMREEARRHFGEALSVNPRDADALYNLAVSLMREGRLGEAARLYRRALEVRPDYGPALLNLGAVQMRMGLTEEAISSYRRLLAVDPESVPGRKSLERALRLGKEGGIR